MKNHVRFFLSGFCVGIRCFNGSNTGWKKYDKEHVTPFIRNFNKNKKFNIVYKEDLSNIRLTFDEIEDFDSLKKIFNYFNLNIYFGWKKIVSSIKKKKIILK